MIDNYAVLKEKEGETKDVSVSLFQILNISRTVLDYENMSFRNDI